MIRTRRNNQRNTEGFMLIEFLAGMGFLLLPLAILVMVFPTWAERQSMGRVAAREAARTYVLTGDQARAQAVVDGIAADYGMKPGQYQLTFPDLAPQLARGQTVTAQVNVNVPVTNIPVWNLDTDAFTLTSRHREVVDQYRSISP